MPEDVTQVTKDSVVSLQEVTADTVRAICRLDVRPDQQNLVATNAQSISQAYFSEHAWFRALYADAIPVGFVMLHEEPDKAEYFLWRLMIGAQFQRMGLGSKAMALVIEHVKTRPGASEFITSVVQEDDSAQGFYERLGFKPTGEIDDGEVVLKLLLKDAE